MKTIIFLIVIFLSSFSVKDNPTQLSRIVNKSHPLAQGLIGCYPFWEGGGSRVINLVGNRQVNDGSLVNGVFGVTPLGRCIKFDGTTDRVTFGLDNSPWLSSEQPTKYSIGAWVSTNTITSNHYIANWRSISNTEIWFMLDHNTNTFRFLVGDGTNLLIVTSPAIVATNTVYYVMGVRDGNNGYLYVNGRLVASGSASLGTVDFSSHDFVIGAQSFDYNACWNGSIRDVMLYKRALTATEVNQLYTNPNCIYITNGDL